MILCQSRVKWSKYVTNTWKLDDRVEVGAVLNWIVMGGLMIRSATTSNWLETEFITDWMTNSGLDLLIVDHVGLVNCFEFLQKIRPKRRIDLL